VGRFLDRYIGNDTLKVILQGNMLYYHDDPYTMSLAFFAKAQASFIHLGSFFIKGGSQKLSDALAAVIRSNGGTVLLAKQVTKVLIRKGRAVGVIFRDAFNAYLPSVEARADFIIYNGAAPLLPGLLEGRPKDRLQKKIAGLKPSLSLFCIHLGFKEAISGRINHHYSTFIYGDEVQAIGNIRPNYYADWKERGFVFVDYSQIDSGLAPDGKGFGMICAADRLSDWEELEEQSYKTRKEEVARILIGRLDQAFPGIAEKIEYYQVGTPRTIRRYTLNPAGAPYGYAQIIGQTGAGRLSHRSPVRNLMLAGAWTSPGGGFTGSVISGFLCGLEVNKKLMANKQEREDDHFTDPRVVKLLKRELIARNTMELTFEKPEGFVFDPGQYAILSLNLPAFTDLDMPFRSLSMATHPGEKVLKFLMRRGESSFKRSCEALKDGDKVTVYGPAGSFTLRDQVEGVVFLASGIGISPVVSMLKELIIQRYSHPLFLFYSCPTESDAAYHRFLRQIELPKYRYIPVFSRNQGRITEGMLVKELKEPEVLTYFLVGAAGFVTGMASLLHALRVPPGSILTDDFG
jgi:ferredoxin-NADP reductase